MFLCLQDAHAPVRHNVTYHRPKPKSKTCKLELISSSRVVVPRKLLTDSLALFHRAIISNDSVCWHVAARKIKRVRARGRMPGRPHAAAQASTEVSRRGR